MRLVTDQPDRVERAARRGRPRRSATTAATTFYATDSDRLIVELVRSGIPFADLTVRGATLEEAFLHASPSAHTDAPTRPDDHAARSAQKEMNR